MKTQIGKQKMLAGGMLLAMAMLSTACGGFKTNPTEGYDDLKTFGPKSDKVVKPQLDCNWVFPPPQYDVPNFIEGQQGTFEITAGVTVEGVGYRVNATGLPKGATFVQGDQPGKYVLTYTPPVGTIPRGGRPSRIDRFQIALEVLNAGGDAAACVNPVNGKTYDVQFVTSKSGDLPMIKSATAASATVVQGESVAVSVDAIDASAAAGSAPTLQVSDEQGGNGVLKGKDAVSFGDGKAAGEGVFHFDGKFDSSKITLPSGKNEATYRFVVRIKSQDRSNTSAGTSVDVKVVRKTAAPAAPAPAKPKTEDVKPGDKK